mmetsp:Transcript_81601/g.236575  ORF Transcript_81601/g.236575 Transcript_81601/m.236575 type:complete len:312 (-) Transcript_81601:468-1403(-)
MRSLPPLASAAREDSDFGRWPPQLLGSTAALQNETTSILTCQRLRDHTHTHTHRCSKCTGAPTTESPSRSTKKAAAHTWSCPTPRRDLGRPLAARDSPPPRGSGRQPCAQVELAASTRISPSSAGPAAPVPGKDWTCAQDRPAPCLWRPTALHTLPVTWPTRQSWARSAMEGRGQHEAQRRRSAERLAACTTSAGRRAPAEDGPRSTAGHTAVPRASAATHTSQRPHRSWPGPRARRPLESAPYRGGRPPTTAEYSAPTICRLCPPPPWTACSAGTQRSVRGRPDSAGTSPATRGATPASSSARCSSSWRG